MPYVVNAQLVNQPQPLVTSSPLSSTSSKQPNAPCPIFCVQPASVPFSLPHCWWALADSPCLTLLMHLILLMHSSLLYPNHLFRFPFLYQTLLSTTRPTMPNLVDAQLLGLPQLALLIKRLLLQEEGDVTSGLIEVGVGRRALQAAGGHWWGEGRGVRGGGGSGGWQQQGKEHADRGVVSWEAHTPHLVEEDPVDDPHPIPG